MKRPTTPLHRALIVVVTFTGAGILQAGVVFSDTFNYNNADAFTTAPPDGGGWTALVPGGTLGSNIGVASNKTTPESKMWGNPIGGTGNKSAGVEYNYPTALAAGETITMDATILRAPNYQYGMRVILWDGANIGTRTVLAGGTQAPTAIGPLTQVSYTVTSADISAGHDHVIFRFSHDSNWGETADVTFSVDPPPSGWTWNNVAGGSWALPGNWSPAGPADGADQAALINQLDITGPQTITLDGSHTIGSMQFADIAGDDGDWLLNGGTGGSLTLSAPLNGSPGILVANRSATVAAILTGSEGMTKTGGGTLVLGAANTYSGGTFIKAGTLRVADPAAIPSGTGNGDVTLATTLDLNDTSITLNGLSGTGIVTNSGTGTPTLTLGPEDIGTTFAGIIGNGTGVTSVVKSSLGTQTLSGNNTFSGSLTVDVGTLAVSGQLRTVSGITVNTGATVELGAENMFLINHGTAMDAARVITVDGGNLVMTGLMISRIGNIKLSNDAYWTSDRGLTGWDVLLANTNTGPATISVANTGGNTNSSFMGGSGGIHLQGVQNFDVDDVTGDAEKDLEVAMVLANAGSAGGLPGGVNKLGTGTLTMTAANTYTGNTIVAAGTLELAQFAQLKFVIGATSGVSNKLSGAGNAIINGSFDIDTTAAAALTNGSWTLEDVSSLTGPYGSSFNVVGFTDAGNNKWTKTEAANLWVFDEVTGILTLGAGTVNDYDTWATSNAYWTPGAPDTAPGEDFDHDGVTNRNEWIFGLNPTAGASANPITVPLKRSSGTFSYTRRDPALTGQSFTCEWSASLAAWTPVVPAVADIVVQSGDNQTVTVNLTEAPGNPLANSTVFVRIVSTP